MDAFEILVIILSVFLTIFLLLAIAALVKFISWMRKVDKMTEKAGVYAQNLAATFGEFVKKTVTPSVIASGLLQFARKARQAYKEDNKDKEE